MSWLSSGKSDNDLLPQQPRALCVHSAAVALRLLRITYGQRRSWLTGLRGMQRPRYLQWPGTG